MNWIRTEEEAESLLNEMIGKNKSNYITQGVAFNKNSESQMRLLKMALMSSYSFGGMIKELLNERFSNDGERSLKKYETIPKLESVNLKQFESDLKQFERIENSENKKVGNFL